QAYLFTCVRNAILSEARIAQRHVELAEEAAWFEPPDRDFAQERTLRLALIEIPQDQRQVLVMHIWGELTFSQIAEGLEISANTAASRYRYALAKLRECLCGKEKPCVPRG